MSKASQKDDQVEATKKPDQGRFDFSAIAFMLKRPYSHEIEKGPLQLTSREEYRQLLETAKKNKMYVWTAAVTQDGDKFMLSHMHVIDWDSVPDQAYEGVETPRATKQVILPPDPEDLTCPICRTKCSSKSGYTLHMKKHRADEDKAIEAGEGALVCPVCKKLCSSTSGLTLHKKNAHPNYKPECVTA